MTTYQIISRTGGQSLGTFEADSADEAFRACCLAAGYPDLAAVDADGTLLCDRSDVRIVECVPCCVEGCGLPSEPCRYCGQGVCEAHGKSGGSCCDGGACEDAAARRSDLLASGAEVD